MGCMLMELILDLKLPTGDGPLFLAVDLAWNCGDVPTYAKKNVEVVIEIMQCLATCLHRKHVQSCF